MKKVHVGKIEDVKEINKSVYSMSFSATTLTNIEPGEYVSILCGGLTLRRPFSVADFKDGVVTVLIKRRGEGTKYLSSLKTGDKIEFSAPLGNTFKIENKKTLLIGAGIGVAPLFYLEKKLKAAGAQTSMSAGFLTNDDVITPHPQPLSHKGRGEYHTCANIDSANITTPLSPRPLRERENFQCEERALENWVRGVYDFVSTDDGTNGNKGSICDYLDKLIEEFKPEKIVSCAPYPVLKIIAQKAQDKGIECEVAMEKVMACGIGVCRGCVIKVLKDGKVQNATVCKDGPVFDGKEVVWQ